MILFLALLGSVSGVQRSAVAEAVDGEQSAVEHWRAEAGPLTVNGTYTVASGETLVVHPGVTVLFGRDAKLEVRGELIVNGSEPEPVHFTSVAAEPVGGDWRGVVLQGTGADRRAQGALHALRNLTVEFAFIGVAGTATRLMLDNVSVRHSSGPGLFGDRVDIALRSVTSVLNGGNGIGLRASNVTARDIDAVSNGNHGMHLETSVASGEDITLANNTGGLYCVESVVTLERLDAAGNRDRGILAEGSKVTLRTATITDNAGGGVVLRDCGEVDLSQMRVSNNTGVGLEVMRAFWTLAASEIANNTGDGVHGLETSGRIANSSVIGNGGVGLYGSNLLNRVVDNQFLRNAGHAIFFDSNCTAAVRGNTISDNGGSGIFVYASNPVLVDNVIDSNEGDGIYCRSVQGTIENCTLRENGREAKGLVERGGVYIEGGTITVRDCDIGSNANGVVVSAGGAATLVSTSIVNSSGVGVIVRDARLTAIGCSVTMMEGPTQTELAVHAYGGATVKLRDCNVDHTALEVGDESVIRLEPEGVTIRGADTDAQLDMQRMIGVVLGVAAVAVAVLVGWYALGGDDERR